MLRIKTQWICWALLLFLLLVNNAEAKAQSANELINEYRAWMAEHYPRPEGMDTETLFRTTLWAIYDGQREPEVKTLLRAAAQKVPELQAYADWLDSGKSDPCSEAGTRALQALTRASGEQLGTRHPATAWCRLLLSIQLSTTRMVPPPPFHPAEHDAGRHRPGRPADQRPATTHHRDRPRKAVPPLCSQTDPVHQPSVGPVRRRSRNLSRAAQDRAGSPHPLPRPVGNRRPHPGLPLLPAGRSQVHPEPSGGSQPGTKSVWLAGQYRIQHLEQRSLKQRRLLLLSSLPNIQPSIS